MARTSRGVALTEAHRAAQAEILGRVSARLSNGWGDVDPEDLRGTLDPWVAGALASTVAGWRASVLAAFRYYAALRAAEGFGAWADLPLPEAPPVEETRSAVVGPAVRGIMVARRDGATPSEAKSRALVRVTGSVVSAVASGGRSMILGAAAADPVAVGYQRVTDGDPCAFCRMLASRGIFAVSEGAAGFKAHGHCGCTAEPAFEGDGIRPDNAKYREEWDAATRGEAEALKAFRRYVDGSRDGAP